MNNAEVFRHFGSGRSSRASVRAWLAILVLLPLARVNAENGSFTSDGVKLQYVLEGQGPPVVLIHGFTADSDWQWGEPGIIKALAQNHRVIAIDCRGHGKSDKPHQSSAYGIQMVQDVQRLLDHLEIKKAHIVGYSLGSSIALKFLVTYPSRCSSVVLGEPAVYHETYDFSEENKAAHNMALLSFPEDIMPKQPPSGTLDEIIRWRESWLRIPHDLKAYVAVLQSLDALKITDGELRSNRVPTLGLFCKAGPQSEYLSTHMEHFKAAYMGGSHQDAFRRPEFIAKLKAFLDAQANRFLTVPNVLK